MDKLKPCPFCNAGETQIIPESYWTGTSSTILSVTVRHWCKREEGELQSIISIKRKTEAGAISAWNNRPTATTVRAAALCEPKGE